MSADTSTQTQTWFVLVVYSGRTVKELAAGEIRKNQPQVRRNSLRSSQIRNGAPSADRNNDLCSNDDVKAPSGAADSKSNTADFITEQNSSR